MKRIVSVPEISFRQLTEKDEFVVLATDGVGVISCFSGRFYYVIKNFGICTLFPWNLIVSYVFVDLGCAIK